MVGLQYQPRSACRLTLHWPPQGDDVGAGWHFGGRQKQAEETAADVGMAGHEDHDRVLRSAPYSTPQLLELPLHFLLSHIIVHQHDGLHRLDRPETHAPLAEKRRDGLGILLRIPQGLGLILADTQGEHVYPAGGGPVVIQQDLLRAAVDASLPASQGIDAVGRR